MLSSIAQAPAQRAAVRARRGPQRAPLRVCAVASVEKPAAAGKVRPVSIAPTNAE